MFWLKERWYDILAFIDMGGPVLWAILVLLFVMWLMILERSWFYFITYPKLRNKIIADWDAREDTTTWYAKRIKEAKLAELATAIGTAKAKEIYQHFHPEKQKLG